MKLKQSIVWSVVPRVSLPAMAIALVFIANLATAAQARGGYLHTSGTQLVDGNGSKILLAGANLESFSFTDPFWTDGVSLSGTWNQPGADVPYMHSIAGQIGQTTGDWIKVDDTDSSVTYSSGWNLISNYGGNPGYMNSQHWSTTVGSSATFTFTGNQAEFFGYKRSDLGYANVYIDGKLKASIDCYNAIPYYNEPLYTVKGLKTGTHTMTVQVSSTKDPLSSNTQVICDAFAYGTAATHGLAGNQQAWCNNVITKADIANMASLGLNCVRVNMDCRLFGTVHTTNGSAQLINVDTTTPAVGFQYLDKLLNWCNTYHVYAILDMHMFLFGITDSQQSLNSEEALWQAIASRYATNAYVGGYDLWNEPDSADGSYTLDSTLNQTIVYVQQALVTAIRQVDSNHTIFLEGYPWDDRLDCLFYDPNTGLNTSKLTITDPAGNLALEFHRYGGTLPDAYTASQDNGPDGSDYSGSSPAYLWTIPHQKKLASIAGVPLVCGEMGYSQNSFLQMQQDLNRRSTDPTDYGISAGTIFWCWKKSNSGGVVYYPWPSPTAGQGFDLVNSYWNELDSYWAGNASQPTPTFTNQQADTYIYNYCTSVNASNCKTSWPVAGFLDEGNLVNPGFEADVAVVSDPQYWNNWAPTGQVATSNVGGGHTGSWYLVHGSTAGSYQLYTYQDINNLPIGTYTVSAWVKSSGGQSTEQVQLKYYDSSGNVQTANIPASITWTKVTIPNVSITSGTCEVGIYSVGSAGQWADIDDVAVTIN